MPHHSPTARRVRVAPGIYEQNGAYHGGFREPGTGRWRMKKLQAENLREAKRERESILAGLREGRRAPRSAVTFAAYASEWIASREGRVKPRTVQHDREQLHHLLPALGHLPLQAITVADVRRLLRGTAHLSEWSRCHILRAFRAVMKMAVDEGLVVRDPSDALQHHEKPKQRSARKGRRLSPAELQNVLDTAERLRPGFAPVIVTCAYTGARIREVLGLRWQDLDLDTAVIRLRFQLGRDDRGYEELKTEAASRDVPILPALRRRLIEHRLASPWTRPGDPVFASAKGTPQAYRNVRRALAAIGEQLGLDLTSHDFRRSLASFLIVQARADEAAITGMLGHADIETTRRIYAADWRTAEERNALVLRQLAAAGIGQ